MLHEYVITEEGQRSLLNRLLAGIHLRAKRPERFPGQLAVDQAVLACARAGEVQFALGVALVSFARQERWQGVALEALIEEIYWAWEPTAGGNAVADGSGLNETGAGRGRRGGTSSPVAPG